MTTMTRARGVGRKVAHDPGDPLVTSHCPFCGSGQVVGRSDGTIACDFCGQSYIVRVQPAFPGMPQMPMGPGAPSDVGPDGGLVDPGMVGPDGMPMDGEGPPPGEDGEEGGPLEGPPDDGDDAPPPGGDDDATGSGPPPKGKSKKKSSLHGIAVRRYNGLEGQPLTEDQFLRHVAVRASGADPRVMARLRAEGRRGRRPPRKTAMHVERNHGDMPEHELRRHMRDRHGFIDSPDDPDWLIDETHRNEHADYLHDHLHPDLEHEHDLDTHLGDRDWLHQNGIEGSRRTAVRDVSNSADVFSDGGDWDRMRQSLAEHGFPDSRMHLDTGHRLWTYHVRPGGREENEGLFGRDARPGFHVQVWHPAGDQGHVVEAHLGEVPEHVGPLMRRMFARPDVLGHMRDQMYRAQGAGPDQTGNRLMIDMTRGR